MLLHACLLEPSGTGSFGVRNPAYAIVGRLEAGHPLRALFERHPWLGGIDQVCELFRILMMVFGDRLGGDRLGGHQARVRDMHPDRTKQLIAALPAMLLVIAESRRQNLHQCYVLAVQGAFCAMKQYSWLQDENVYRHKQAVVEMTELFLAMLLCVVPLPDAGG